MRKCETSNNGIYISDTHEYTSINKKYVGRKMINMFVFVG